MLINKLLLLLIFMVIMMVEVMEGRFKPVEMEGGKALIGDVRSMSASASSAYDHDITALYQIIIIIAVISSPLS